MNAAVLVLSSILAASQAASVVPIDSSSVSVQQSGQDYAYTIQENHGLAIDPSHVIHQQIPVAKTGAVPADRSILQNPTGQKGIQHVQDQIHGQGQEHGQATPAGQIEGHNVRPQEQLKAINYVAPAVETYQIVPSNIQYSFSYPYGVHYPFNLIRII